MKEGRRERDRGGGEGCKAKYLSLLHIVHTTVTLHPQPPPTTTTTTNNQNNNNQEHITHYTTLFSPPHPPPLPSPPIYLHPGAVYDKSAEQNEEGKQSSMSLPQRSSPSLAIKPGEGTTPCTYHIHGHTLNNLP